MSRPADTISAGTETRASAAAGSMANVEIRNGCTDGRNTGRRSCGTSATRWPAANRSRICINSLRRARAADVLQLLAQHDVEAAACGGEQHDAGDRDLRAASVAISAPSLWPMMKRLDTSRWAERSRAAATASSTKCSNQVIFARYQRAALADRRACRSAATGCPRRPNRARSVARCRTCRRAATDRSRRAAAQRGRARKLLRVAPPFRKSRPPSMAPRPARRHRPWPALRRRTSGPRQGRRAGSETEHQHRRRPSSLAGRCSGMSRQRHRPTAP